MAKQIVNIVLRGDGGTQVANEFAKVRKASTDFVVNIKKIGGVFGELGGAWGDLVSNIAKGGVWGIMNAAVQGSIKLCVKWYEAWKEKGEAYQKTMTDALTTMADRMAAYKVTVEDVAKAERAAVDAGANRLKSQIGLTEQLTKATIELARQKRIAAGESAERVNAESDSAISEASAQAARERSDAEIAAIKERIKIAQSARAAAKAEEKRIREYQKAAGSFGVYDDAEANKKAVAWRKSLESKYLDARKAGRHAEKSEADESVALADALKRREALEANIQAQELKAENEKAAKEKESAEKEAAAAKKSAEERQKAEIAAAQAVAKERARLEQEAHDQRMADLRAEIAEQSKAAARQSAVASAAQSEFDKAFAMYRDPSRAAAVIGEEQDYRNDLDRLHKDARRYGGKWRIDELSSLMAAGDTQGVSDTLATWRKSKGFTPEVEAMVRASAAEQTKTTAEDELKKVNAELEKLSADLQSLASDRNAKLDGIERNTSGLAAKVDELLTVKG